MDVQNATKDTLDTEILVRGAVHDEYAENGSDLDAAISDTYQRVIDLKLNDESMV